MGSALGAIGGGVDAAEVDVSEAISFFQEGAQVIRREFPTAFHQFREAAVRGNIQGARGTRQGIADLLPFTSASRDAVSELTRFLGLPYKHTLEMREIQNKLGQVKDVYSAAGIGSPINSRVDQLMDRLQDANNIDDIQERNAQIDQISSQVAGLGNQIRQETLGAYDIEEAMHTAGYTYKNIYRNPETGALELRKSSELPPGTAEGLDPHPLGGPVSGTTHRQRFAAQRFGFPLPEAGTGIGEGPNSEEGRAAEERVKEILDVVNNPSTEDGHLNLLAPIAAGATSREDYATALPALEDAAFSLQRLGDRDIKQELHMTEEDEAMSQQAVTDKLKETPAYQFQFEQGMQALERSQAAKGELGGGRALLEAQTFGQGLAENAYQAHIARLGGLAGIVMPGTQQAASGIMGLAGNNQQGLLGQGLNRQATTQAMAQASQQAFNLSGQMSGQAAMQQAQLQQQANMANAQSSQASLGGIGKLAGTLIGGLF